MSGRDVNVFVARHGNAFMRDIATWVVEAASLNGRTAEMIDDRLPQPDGSTNLVVAPHEFYLLRDDSDADVRTAARCSVPICTEQPGTPWFLLSLGFCVGSPLVADINPAGLGAIEREGFAAHRLELGGVPSMDRTESGAVDKDIDVLFLGGATDRRGAALARLGPELWEHHAELRLFSFSQPIQGDEPGVVFGDDKYDLLARSKVLVNLHRDEGSDGYFEWARMVETMANRCAVVTEPSRGCEPLKAGTHFVESGLDDLATAVTDLLADEVRRATIADAAHRAVIVEQPLARSVGQLLERVEEPTVAVAGGRTPIWRRRAARRPIVRSHRPPLLPEFTPLRALRRELHDEFLAEMHHRRSLGKLRCLIEHGEDDHAEHITTPAFASAAPDVSVIVTLYNYGEVVTETLDSIAASHDVNLEVVVVDDHSSDDGRLVVRTFLDQHPDLPMMLLASNVNRGLPDARNLAIENTRAERIMVMDADNTIYPTCLRRLSDALDLDPDASFAYATLEAFGTDPGLRSSRGWYVPWLCEANYIDAQAMLRRDTWERHGGYRHDDRVYGWEDWDLWLRLAQAGEHGVHVPQMLGRYRTQAASMISITDLAAPDMRAELVERYPTLPWPELADS